MVHLLTCSKAYLENVGWGENKRVLWTCPREGVGKGSSECSLAQEASKDRYLSVMT